ncbi:hypothetical protein [Arthrobacter humicola]|uniref:hypothetical protein n=1 Tax=Arthrobacter humicola TaxID=409291 RepID=UPI0031D8E26E
MTEILIRSSRATDRRYERDAPGDMIHINVKKLGRIPGGPEARFRLRPRAAIDDHTGLAYAEVFPDEKGTACAGFLTRAAAAMAARVAPV